MKTSNFLRTAILSGASALLLGTGTQAGPMPTHVATMKSMVDQNTTEVRWGGGYGYRGGGWGYRGGLGYRGGWGHRGYGYRGLGYGVAGAVVGGAIARNAYYGGYYGSVPAYGYRSASYYGYGGGSNGYGYGGSYCPSYGGYADY